MTKITRLTAKTQKEHRAILAKRQDYKCYLCGKDLTTITQQEWHLDHDHDDGNCRSVLCSVCNSVEGKIKNRVNLVVSYSKTDMSPADYLRKLADYWDQDFSNEPIYESHAREQIKRFKRLTAKQQCEMISEHNVEPGKNINDRTKQARKLLKDGKIWL